MIHRFNRDVRHPNVIGLSRPRVAHPRPVPCSPSATTNGYRPALPPTSTSHPGSTSTPRRGRDRWPHRSGRIDRSGRMPTRFESPRVPRETAPTKLRKERRAARVVGPAQTEEYGPTLSRVLAQSNRPPISGTTPSRFHSHSQPAGRRAAMLCRGRTPRGLQPRFGGFEP